MKNLPLFFCLFPVLTPCFLFAQFLDLSFPETDGEVFVARLHGGTLYIGGNFNEVDGQLRSNVAAIDLATRMVTDWNPGVAGEVSDIEVANGRVYLCGDFVSVDGEPRNTLAAVDSLTGDVTGFNPTIVFPGIPGLQTGGIFSIETSGNLLYLGGYFLSVQGQLRSNIAAIDLNTLLPTSLAPSLDIPVLYIALRDNTLYFSGPFYEVNDVSRQGFAAVDAATGMLKTWNPSAGNPGNSMNFVLPTSEAIYVAGSFSLLQNISRVAVAQTHPQSGTPSGWNAHISLSVVGTPVLTLSKRGDLLIVGGSFENIGGQNAPRLAMLDEVQGNATTWAPSPDGTVHSTDINEEILVVGGSFFNIEGVPRRGLAVYRFDGKSATANAAASFLHVFPNPATSQVRIEPAPESIRSIWLTTATGASRPAPCRMLPGRVDLDISACTEGLHYLTLRDDAGRLYTAKISVVR